MEGVAAAVAEAEELLVRVGAGVRDHADEAVGRAERAAVAVARLELDAVVAAEDEGAAAGRNRRSRERITRV